MGCLVTLDISGRVGRCAADRKFILLNLTLDEPPEVTELPSDAFSVTTSLELTAALLSVSFTPCPVFTVVVEPSVPVVVDVFA